MDKKKLINFAKEQCEIFPEDSYMGRYLRETLRMLQAEPCEGCIEFKRYAKQMGFNIEKTSISCDDCVSRKQALKELKESAEHHANDSREEALLRRDRDIIRALPSVKPVACIAKKVEEMEKHTDRQIYDGCIHLMQKMVDYFEEYLDYLGYDLDKLGEDERFAVEISNMEIVRWLFLFNTRNSGGCSTRDFCEKIGIDSGERVKFEIERYEEE